MGDPNLIVTLIPADDRIGAENAFSLDENKKRYLLPLERLQKTPPFPAVSPCPRRQRIPPWVYYFWWHYRWEKASYTEGFVNKWNGGQLHRPSKRESVSWSRICMQAWPTVWIGWNLTVRKENTVQIVDFRENPLPKSDQAFDPRENTWNITLQVYHQRSWLLDDAKILRTTHLNMFYNLCVVLRYKT